jgi:membrane-associated phospholipid phosphatase
MGSRPEQPRASRVSPAAAGALLCLVLLAVTGFVALAGARVRAADETVLRGFRSLDSAWADGLLSSVAHLADPGIYVLVGAVLVAVAVRRRGRPALGAGIAILLVGSAVMTQALKHALAQPRLVDWLGSNQVGDASWPSGHATAAMALALAGVLVARPGHRRAAVVAGAVFAGAVAVAVLALAWHFPSDVLGGFLVAAAWALGVLAGLEVLEPARRTLAWDDVRRFARLAGGVVAAGALAAGLALALRSAGAVESLVVPAKLAGAVVIAVAAAALPLAMSRVVDRS